MRFENGNIVDLLACAEGKQLVAYGANSDLGRLCKQFSSYNLWERIDLITDKVTNSENFAYDGEQKQLIAFETFCASLSPDSQCVILFTGIACFVTCDLKRYNLPENTVFYIGEFLKHSPPPVQIVSVYV